jgi:hypothetical protein
LSDDSSVATAEISFENEPSFDSTSIDLSEAVIDEPDLSSEIVENPVQEPALDELSIDDAMDINIDMNAGSDTAESDTLEDFTVEIGDDPELPVSEDLAASPLEPETSETDDDHFDQVIPEGFEVGAAEAPVSFDDELDENAFAEESIDAASDTDEADTEITNTEAAGSSGNLNLPSGLKNELKTVLSYMDQLLESLPEDKIEEFAKSEYFDTYKKLFKELGLV